MARRISIDAVWNDAVRVMGERGGPILGVGLLAFAVPPMVQAAIRLLVPMGPARASMLVLLVSIVGLLLSLWGALAVLAIAAEPPASVSVARTAASRRLPASIGVGAVVLVGLMLLSIPLVFVAGAMGTDMAAMAQGGAGMARATAAAGRTILLLTLVSVVFLLWLGARLLPVQAVILHERLGLRALVRAFSVTRGLALRLVVAELLFAVVVAVAAVAAQAVTGTAMFVALGPERVDLSLFLAAVAGALATATLTALAWVFVARLYAALTGSAPASVERAAPAAI